MKKTIISKVLVSIKDISQGKSKAFVAILHEYNDAKVMGKDMKELADGIKTTIDYLKSKKSKSEEGKSVVR